MTTRIWGCPTRYVLRVEPIEPAAWARIVLVATAVLVVVEADKAIRRRRPRAS